MLYRIKRDRLLATLIGIMAVAGSVSAYFPYDQKPSPKTILFFGNSLTAGYGIDPEQAFPALIQKKIDARNWNFTVINAGLSGETSAGGLRRIDWVLQRKIDVLFLELGGNDGLRGIPLESTKMNLQAIIERTRKKYPEAKVILAGMQIPPNMGPEYITQFREIYPSLARETQVTLLPFLLQDVGGVKGLNLPDGIHPTIKGHAIVAETVWKVLKPVLETIM